MQHGGLKSILGINLPKIPTILALVRQELKEKVRLAGQQAPGTRLSPFSGSEITSVHYHAQHCYRDSGDPTFVFMLAQQHFID